jgi:hypothetical protein
MKQGIFISYSDYDKEKVDLIVNELEGNTKFFPIVIAFKREALKPLAQKVADGIIQAKVILPILTKKSIPTQWINQEIGFATALSKHIMPIVESDLIDNLKGFIHKQIDLPYNFQPNANKALENEYFAIQIRSLLADLEENFQKINDFYSRQHNWMDLAVGFDSEPKTIANIILGEVMEYKYSNNNKLYRLKPEPYDPELDNFYKDFDGLTLTNIIAKRKI